MIEFTWFYQLAAELCSWCGSMNKKIQGRIKMTDERCRGCLYCNEQPKEAFYGDYCNLYWAPTMDIVANCQKYITREQYKKQIQEGKITKARNKIKIKYENVRNNLIYKKGALRRH
jgi:hypothetical protein